MRPRGALDGVQAAEVIASGLPVVFIMAYVTRARSRGCEKVLRIAIVAKPAALSARGAERRLTPTLMTAGAPPRRLMHGHALARRRREARADLNCTRTNSDGHPLR